MRIILFSKQENNQKVKIVYNPITKHMGICSQYINIENQKRIDKKYAQSEKGKEIAKQINKKYQQSKKGKTALKKYRQSEKGRITDKKRQAKRNRNLGFTILLKNKFNCDVDYHHINNEYVIAVPRYIHQGTFGKNHRVECNSLVEKLYNIDIGKEVEKYGNKIYTKICK